MQIDWLTVTAQLINFLVLVYLLKRFLYKPVITAMDEREKQIASQLQSAREREAEATKSRQEFERRSAELEQEKQAILAASKNQAQQEYQAQMDASRQKIAEQEGHWQEQLEKEQKAYLDELAQRGGDALLRIVSKVLTELSGKQLQEQIIEVFLQRLAQLPGEQKQRIASSAGALMFISAFELQSEQQARLQQTVGDFSGTKPVEFQVQSQLVCGIELRADAEKISWNIRDYLEALQEEMKNALQQGRS